MEPVALYELVIVAINRRAMKRLDQWAYTDGVEMDFSRRGKPAVNPFIEGFNGRFRQECLDENWVLSLEDAAG